MKAFLTLYKKDLRLIRGISMILIAAAISGLLFSNVIEDVFEIHGPISITGYILMASTMLLFSMILWYSLYVERNARTTYQSSSLPVTRYAPIISKLLAVLTWALLLIAIVAAYETTKTWIMDHTTSMGYGTVRGFGELRAVYFFPNIIRDFFGIAIFYWLPVVYWCGAVMFAEGLAALLKRWRLSIYVFIIGIVLIFQDSFNRFTAVPQFSLALFGLLLALAGIMLYHRYAEV